MTIQVVEEPSADIDSSPGQSDSNESNMLSSQIALRLL